MRQETVTLFSQPEPITDDGDGFRGWGQYSFISEIPSELLNYPVAVSTVCILTPRMGLDNLRGHIGPGANRTVRALLDLDITYTSEDQTEVEGEIWHQVSTDFGPLWVRSTDFESGCEAPSSEPLEVCSLTPRTDLDELWGHVGAGRTRTVIALLDVDTTYITDGQSMVEDVAWYRISTDDFGELWVSGEDMANSCENVSVATPPPVIIPPTATPEPTQQPTAEPTATEEPAETEEPAATQEPEWTQEPEVTQEPEWTQEP